ncbi:hypothetical protein, conserved, partial [Eimeria maxima]
MKGEKEKKVKKRRNVAEKATKVKKIASAQSVPPHTEEEEDLPTSSIDATHNESEEVHTDDDGAPMDVTTKEEEASTAAETDGSESQAAPGPSGGFFSDVLFESLDICEPVKNALKEMKMERLTEIQAKAIPRLLEGKDVLGAAKT